MISLFSPAKINLFLRIVSKRADGYHNLSSLFQTISLGDTLDIELSDCDELVCDDPSLPTDKTNLILKAIELFKRKTGREISFRVKLTKRIPIQSGLGGGSSNAATALWGCNQLAQAQVSVQTLKEWGAEIGSDVPFFFSQGTAYCTGRGENVLDLPPLPSCSLWIVKPEGGLSTPEVYRRLNFVAAVPGNENRDDLDSFLSGKLSHFNDLERPAFEIRPDLYQLKETLLSSGFDRVLLSGSGSAFFCLGKGEVLQQPQLKIFKSKFVNRPSFDWYPEC